MIDQVRFHNFKSLRDVTLDLGKFTVLVGPNGSGKSSVLEAIRLLSLSATPGPGDYSSHVWRRFAPLFGRDGIVVPFRVASRGSGGLTLPAEMNFTAVDGVGGELHLSVHIFKEPPEHSNGDECRFDLSLSTKDELLAVSLPDDFSKRGQDDLLANPRLSRFASAELLQLDQVAMTNTSVSVEEVPYLTPSGDNLASTLAWMKGAAEENLEQLQLALGKVVPGARRIRTYRERVTRRRMDRLDVDSQPVWRPVEEKVLGDRFEIEFDNGASIPADLLSEGTVLALGLLTKLYEKDRPSLLIVDDIDRGLHIEAQAKLVEVLRQLLVMEKDLQIVCTTHSPYLLDRFAPEEVRVLGLDSNRFTEVRRLTEHPEFEQWKYGNQTGELWGALGSSWVAAPSAHHE